MPNTENLRELMRRLDYTFRSLALLEEAITHPSVNASNNRRTSGSYRSYQRLEFVGDAVVNLLVAEELFRRFPDATEGDLTTFRSFLSSNQKLSEVAQALGLDQFLIMSKGEEKQNGRHDWYILSCVLEAVCGATLIDSGGGYLVVKKILRKHLLTDQLFQSVNVRNLADFDPKSTLQRIAQAKFDITPSYKVKVVDVNGPDEVKQYTVWAMLEENRVGIGTGRSKQEAQKNAAADALQQTNYLSSNLPFGALRARAILNDLIPERE